LSNSDITLMNFPKQCLVIGGRGFIGSHLVDALLDAGYFVRCFDRPDVVPLRDTHLTNPIFELFEGDCASEADIAEALVDCDICYHLVSTTLPKSSNVDPIFDIQSNLIGTLHLLTHAVKSGLQKIIFVSSGGTVYGEPIQVPTFETHSTDPLCSYGITKLAIEKYLRLFHRLHGLDYSILRLSNPFGERQRTHASQGAVAVFLGKVLRGEPIEIWGDGSVIRDYVYIADVINALMLCINNSTVEHVFNIGSGCGYSLNDVLDAIEKVTGRLSERRYTLGRAFDIPVSVLNIERAKKYLGWAPRVDFDYGLERFAAWVIEHEK
jgi:UDP-glucose 4-epimerase